jgi:uncharacterized protein
MEIKRADIALLIRKLKMAPAVAILGPRQVGKTTLAIQAAIETGRSHLYLDMESGQDLARLGDDPETFFKHHNDKLIIIDEIQAHPILFSRLRSIIDRDKTSGRFLILGSASPNLVHGVSESLAGRVSYLDLNPLRLEEIQFPYDWIKHWFRGGFPRAFLAENDEAYVDWMQSYIRTYIQSDLSSLFGYNLNPTITRRLWTMLAHLHGNLSNHELLSKSIGVTAPVINRYIDFLNGAFLLYRLQPWTNNGIKRVVKSPKIYIKDSGILHALLSISTFDELTLNPAIGQSWEGYVIEQIMYHKNRDVDLYFYRTHSGTEIDLVLVKGNKPIASIEIKYSNAPKPTKGFYIGIEDLQTTQNFIITPNSDSYPSKNALVCNLMEFLRDYLPRI